LIPPFSVQSKSSARVAHALLSVLCSQHLPVHLLVAALAAATDRSQTEFANIPVELESGNTRKLFYMDI
jgi:alpha-D-ribose 1-methylphosphonate 5-triphosphate diphosphatase PhnM